MTGSAGERPDEASDHAFAEAAEAAIMVTMLPCGDIDEISDFWAALGLERSYRQVRPNPYIALRAGAIELHYYGMPTWVPDDSHSTCVIAVPDPAPLYDRFRAGLRERFGRVPVSGIPRMTRPRANNGGLSGFSVVDPAGNWVRVTRAPAASEAPPTTSDDRTAWTSSATDALGRALENAVVIGDSHGDHAQARKVLEGALRRATDASPGDRAVALAYLVELQVRSDDPAAASAALAELEALEVDDADDRERVETARAEAREALDASR